MEIALIIPWRPNGDRQVSLKFIMEHLCRALNPSEVILSDDPDPIQFNRGRAINAGVDKSSSRMLVFADADLWVPESALQYAIERATSMPEVYVVPFNRVAFLNQQTSYEVLSQQIQLGGEWTDDQLDLRWDRLSVGGINVMTRVTFELVGRFDPRFRGWGFEDSAFDQAAGTLGGGGVWISEQAVHLHHPTSRNPEDNQFHLNQDLCRRYEEAYGDQTRMAQIVQEGREYVLHP